MESEPSSEIFEQRIRNRIIECLEEIAQVRSEEDLLSPYDMINDLEGWLDERGHPRPYPEPIYTADEVRTLIEVRLAFNALCAALPKFFETAEMMKKQEWLWFRRTSRLALDELSKRGRLSEEEEAGK